MRLTEREIEAIKGSVHKIDPMASMQLFGSRTDDYKQGGDIDLLIDSQVMEWRDIAKLRGMLFQQLGEQKIDIIIKRLADPSFLGVIEADACTL